MSMQTRSITLPLTLDVAQSLRAGETVLLSGELYTARDAAHKRLVALLDEGKPLPFDPMGQTIYYVGPAPASPGHAVGSAGPTSSYRMDAYAPQLLEAGILGIIGKGRRGPAVIESMRQHGAVYFGAVGGAAALISRRIEKSEVIAFADLGAESLHRFTIKDFPALVLIDSQGHNLYESGPAQYRL